MDDGVSERFGKNWSVEEERTLLDSYRAHGPNWDLIQSILPQRKGIVSKWKRLVATGNTEAIELQKQHRVLRDKRNEQEAAQAAANGVSHVPPPMEPDSPGDSGLSGNGQSSAKRARRAEAFEVSKAHGVTFEQQTQYSHGGGAVEQRSGSSNQPSAPVLTVTSVGMGMGGMGGGVGGAPHPHLGAPMAGNLAGMAPTSMAYASLAPSATHAAMQVRREMGYLGAMGGDITTLPPMSLPNQGHGVVGGHAGAAERMGQGHSMGSSQLIHPVDTRKRRHELHEPAHMNAGGSNGMAGLTVMGEGLGLGLGLDFAGYHSAASTPNGAAALAVRRAGGNAAVVEAEAGAPVPAAPSLPEGSTIIFKTVNITVQVPVPSLPAHVFPDPQHAQEWMHEYATAYADHYATAYAHIHGDAHVRAYHDYVAQVPIRTAMAARAAAQRVTQTRLGSNPGGEGAGHRTGLMQSNSSGMSGMGHALSTGVSPSALQLDLSAGHATGLTSPSQAARTLGRLGANVVGLASLVEAVESESAGEDRDRGHEVAVAPAPVGSTMPGPLPPMTTALSPVVPRAVAGRVSAYAPLEHKMEHSASAGSDGEATVRTHDSAGGSTVTTEGGSSSSSSTAGSGQEQATVSATAAAEGMAGEALQRMVAVM